MIFLRPLGGLCNRLRALNSAIKLSHDAGCRLVVFWQLDPEMNTRFCDLFSAIHGVPVFETEYYRLFQRAIFHRHNVLMYRGSVWPIRDDAVACARRVRPWSISTCSEFYPGGEYSWCSPLPGIGSAADAVIKSDGATKSIVGVHIRRTDNEKSCAFSPLSAFVAHMKEEQEQNPDVSFFVASDDPETKRILRMEFGDRILTRESVSNRDDENGVRDALVDLLILSRCRKIFGSYWSSFSSVAALIGNVPLEVVKKSE